jgi:putative DNA primase/helicase
VQVPRRCIIAATTNHDDILSDREENTRYLPFVARTYNREYLLAERNQLWAEAVHLYKAGAKWWLEDGGLRVAAAAVRKEFEERDPWENAISDWLRLEDEATASEALRHLGIEVGNQTKAQQMRVTSLLKKLGWKRHADTRRRVWVKA